jgi:two-component system, NtrC family, response regulator AtoC
MDERNNAVDERRSLRRPSNTVLLAMKAAEAATTNRKGVNMSIERVDLSVDVMRALEGRRAAAVASEVPSHWLLDSPRLAAVVATAKRLAAVATTPIVIQGERGCGVKELARLVHDEDPSAAAGPFKVVPAQFVSQTEMRGWIPHGTLFIEDVENLKAAGQTWIGGVLAERETARRPLRIVVSSRFGVGELLQQKRLSQELVHALDVSRLIVPPLRERPEDILVMARKFLGHYASRLGRPGLRFSATAECKLMSHSYPANVCELRNVVERAVALGASDQEEVADTTIVFYDAPADLHGRRELLPARGAASAESSGRLPRLVDLERDYLVMLIRELRGRRTEISRAMGVSYPTVLKKIAQHRLDVRAIVASDAEEGHVA